MREFDVPPGQVYCVFRRGIFWFALPALSVREVLLRPAITLVPNARALLTGLCHVRSEFLPVLNLGPLLGGDAPLLTSEAQMLVVESADGHWGLLVDQVAALTPLETSVAPEENSTPWFTAVLGWATYQDQLVRVLEPAVFYRMAESCFEEGWAVSNGDYREDRSDADAAPAKEPCKTRTTLTLETSGASR